VIRIGDVQTLTFIAGISGVNVSGVPVVVSSTGQLGIAQSSRRFKEDIQDMGEVSSSLMRLRPVTYRYKQPFQDGSKPLDFGLIAEEVAEVYPDLVARSQDGQIQTVMYQKLTPMLLNEVQKLKVELNVERETAKSLKDRVGELEALVQQLVNKSK
jgi:trimeric autotransporter adhesin